MKVMSRRKFVGAGLAAAGAAAGLADSAAFSAPAAPLDLFYRTSAGSGASVNYPSGWHLYPKLITDLTSPEELFSLSNQELTPGPSFDESGIPDVSVLGSSGALITIFAQPLGGGRFYAPGQPVSTGVRLDGLNMNTPIGNVQQRNGWFLGTKTGYAVMVWHGSSGPLATVDAILRSFQPS